MGKGNRRKNWGGEEYGGRKMCIRDRHNPDFVEKILERAKRYVLCPENLKVKFAAFGDDVGLIGAALLAEEG